nr:nucleotide-binding, alpha-beta plait [Tanacetum cinerariifolium]
MYSCIILLNMILKDQKMAVFDWNEVYANPARNMQRTWIDRCETQRRKNKEMRDRDTHDALERRMRGSEYGEQDRKAVILYKYETFKATEGEQFLDTYRHYLQVINDLKKCGYKKDNYINIDALYNILKQNQGDVNDSLGYKKKAIVITSDPFALVAGKTKVSKQKEKVVVSLDSKGSGADDFSELKKITALLAKAFNQRKFYSKPINNNLRTSSTS